MLIKNKITFIKCKYCNSPNIVKFGTYKGVQRYFCKDCKRKFKNDDSLLYGKVPADDIAVQRS